MYNPMIEWCVIACVLLCAFVFSAVERYQTRCRHKGRTPKHIFEIGKEKEIFFIPGDPDDDDPDEL